MILLADPPVAVVKIAVDAPPTRDMIGVVRADERGPLRDPEVRFDGIEPGGISGCKHGMNAQASEERQEVRVIMDIVQVIQDDEEPLARITCPQAPEGLAHVDEPFTLAKQTAQAVGMNIVEPEELLGPLATVIRSPHALWPPAPPPRDSAQRLELQRSPFVEADYRRSRRTRPVELADAFFFRSNAGSSDVFQVRIRWARRPSRRRSRRTHSSVIGGSNPRCRQYSASLGTVQAENGKPRSAGLDKAMSISSRIWGPVMIGSRPRGLGGCSKVANPLSLNRCTHSYTIVTLQPTRSATSATERPRATSAITRYRACCRTASRRSLTFVNSTRRSPRVSARSRTELAMLSPFGNSVCGYPHYSSQIKLEQH